MKANLETNETGQTLNLQYNANHVAKSFIEDNTFCTGFFGVVGCGKTVAGVMKVFGYAQNNPGARIAIIRDTMPNLKNTTMVSFFEWLPEGPAGEFARSDKNFFLRTSDPKRPAVIMFRAMDDKKDISNVLSMELAAAWIDEPQGGLNLDSASLDTMPGLDQALVETLLTRVGRQSGYKGMAWMTGNPPSPSHWIANMFQYSGKGEPANLDPDYALYLGGSDLNRHNLEAGYYERMERIYGKNTPLARRYLLGEWVEFGALSPFHRDWIQFYTDEDIRSLDLTIEMGIDPAISKNDGAAKTAIVVAGQSQKDSATRGQVFILDYDSGHWSAYEQSQKVMDLARKWNCRVMRIEDGPLDRAISEVIMRDIGIAGVKMAVETVPRDGDKVLRANTWSGMVENGYVHFKQEHKELIECMMAVPQDKSKWDLVDATGICLRGFPKIYPARSRLAQLQGQYSESEAQAAGYAAPITIRAANPQNFKQNLQKMQRQLNKTPVPGYILKRQPSGYFQSVGVKR